MVYSLGHESSVGCGEKDMRYYVHMELSRQIPLFSTELTGKWFQEGRKISEIFENLQKLQFQSKFQFVVAQTQAPNDRNKIKPEPAVQLPLNLLP